jgi:hypothetical protein
MCTYGKRALREREKKAAGDGNRAEREEGKRILKRQEEGRAQMRSLLVSCVHRSSQQVAAYFITLERGK